MDLRRTSAFSWNMDDNPEYAVKWGMGNDLRPSGPERSSKNFARVAVATFRPRTSGEKVQRENLERDLMPLARVLSDTPQTDFISNPLMLMFCQRIERSSACE